MSHDTTVTSKRHTSVKRHRTTIRIDQEIWRAFIADLRSKHLRSCSVLEALISAYLYGGAMIPGLGRPQHVQLTIQRIVNVPPGREPEPQISESEWDKWVRYYEDTWCFTPVKIGDRAYRLYPV